MITIIKQSNDTLTGFSAEIKEDKFWIKVIKKKYSDESMEDAQLKCSGNFTAGSKTEYAFKNALDAMYKIMHVLDEKIRVAADFEKIEVFKTSATIHFFMGLELMCPKGTQVFGDFKSVTM